MDEEGFRMQLSPDSELEENSNPFQTIRMEVDALPSLVELGRKLLTKVQEGDVEGVKELMQQGAPFTTDWLGTSPLHWACQLNHIEVTEALLTAGISRDSRNKVDRTPLHCTAQEGHVEILKLLLKFGVDVDATDMLGMTPLHWAAEYGHEEVVKMLLESGADPQSVNKFDKTPDQIAFDNNRMDITHLIQEYAESPLLPIRRKEAKERQKKSSAAYKAIQELEKLNRKPFNNGNEVKDVRIIKIPPKRPLETTQKLVEVTSPQILETTTTPPKLILMKKNTPLPHEKLTNGSHLQSNKDGNIALNKENTEKTLAMLQAHGITMLPHDETTIVASAVQSGQKVVLTEAGKMALNLTEKHQMKKLIKLSPQLLKGKRLIKINSQHLAKMRSEGRVLLQGDKLVKQAVFMSKPTVIPVHHLSKTVIEEERLPRLFEDDETGTQASGDTTQSEEEVEVDLDVVGEEEMKTHDNTESELDRVKRELEETKRQVSQWRERCEAKDREIKEYKKLIDLLKIK